MNKYQEALDGLVNIKENFIYHEGKMVQIKNVQNSKTLQELVDKHEKIKKALNKVISERINETGKVLEIEEITYIQALQFVLKLLDLSTNE